MSNGARWSQKSSKVVNAIKAVKIDKCFSLYRLQRGIVGLLWNRRKLWGTVRRVCNAALLRPNERLMKKNRKTNERTLDVRIGREAYGSRGREGERVVVTIITGSQQGQCKFGMVGRRISLQTPPPPSEHFGLPLYFWRSYFFTPSSLLRHRYTGAQHHANLRAYNNVTLNSALATEKGFG